MPDTERVSLVISEQGYFVIGSRDSTHRPGDILHVLFDGNGMRFDYPCAVVGPSTLSEWMQQADTYALDPDTHGSTHFYRINFD
jgi:hypothetical protein